MKFWIIFAGLAFALAGTSVYSQVNEAEKLEAAITAALDVLYLEDNQAKSYEEKQSAVRLVLESNYDLTVIVRRALARNWGLMSAEEQIQVTDLIMELVVKAFVEGMEGYKRPLIAYGDVVQVTSKRLEIPLVVSFADGDVFHVLYRFGRLQSGWQIYDIVAEDISIVSNYRQQFDDHFRKGDGAGLIEKLEKLLEEGGLNEKTKL